MRGICWSPVTNSNLTTFGPRKHIDSTIHPSGRSRDTIPPPPSPGDPPEAVTVYQCNKPGGCDSTPHMGYSSLSRAWGRIYLARRHGLTMGGWSRSHSKYYTYPCWSPGIGRPEPCRHRRQVKSVTASPYQAGEGIWSFFTHRPWKFPIRIESLEKCAVLSTVKPTSARSF